MNFKILTRRLIAGLLIVLAALTCAGCGAKETPPADTAAPLTVTLMKVGKADAIALISGSHALLIDAGEEDDGQEVVDFLRQHQISTLDAMIITHFDRDHVGGADTVVESLKVEKVYLPDYQGTHTEYVDFLAAAEAAQVPLQRLQEPVTFAFGDAQVLIEPPQSYEIPEGTQDYDNNFSLITTVTHGENRLVFTGDAEKQRIRQWLDGDSARDCDFLKVPHHGVYNGALEQLVETLQPEISVICSSRKHPAEQKTLELLKKYCPAVYQTKDGNVTLISTGTELEVHQDLNP